MEYPLIQPETPRDHPIDPAGEERFLNLCRQGSLAEDLGLSSQIADSAQQVRDLLADYRARRGEQHSLVARMESAAELTNERRQEMSASVAALRQLSTENTLWGVGNTLVGKWRSSDRPLDWQLDPIASMLSVLEPSSGWTPMIDASLRLAEPLASGDLATVSTVIRAALDEHPDVGGQNVLSTCSERRVLNDNDVITLLAPGVSDTLSQSELATIEAALADIPRRLTEAVTSLRIAVQVRTAIRRHHTGRITERRQQYRHLVHHHLIRAHLCATSSLVIDTESIKLWDERGGVTIGRFRLTFSPAARAVHLTNLDGRRGECDHPHVINGEAVFGRFTDEIATLLEQGDLADAVQLGLEYLCGYHPGSAAVPLSLWSASSVSQS